LKVIEMVLQPALGMSAFSRINSRRTHAGFARVRRAGEGVMRRKLPLRFGCEAQNQSKIPRQNATNPRRIPNQAAQATTSSDIQTKVTIRKPSSRCLTVTNQAKVLKKPPYWSIVQHPPHSLLQKKK
jgi:hypothetical protein